MTVYLLDVNVLLALFDANHLHHEAAHRWFSHKGHKRWATCPITENGFVRIAAHPAYPNSQGDSAAIAESLRRFCAQPGHQFWPDGVSILTLLQPKQNIASGQVTDLYLLGLAAAQGGKLATFDQKMPVHLLREGPKFVEWLE